MGLCVYHRDDPGYCELDYDALSHEQAIVIADMVHQIVVDYSEIQQLTLLSVRLSEALRLIRPRVVTILDLKRKPLSTWREHPFMTKHLYTELREVTRPWGVRLPAWELLP